MNILNCTKCPLDTLESSNPNGMSTDILQVIGDSSKIASTSTMINMVTTPKRDQSTMGNIMLAAGVVVE